MPQGTRFQRWQVRRPFRPGRWCRRFGDGNSSACAKCRRSTAAFCLDVTYKGRPPAPSIWIEAADFSRKFPPRATSFFVSVFRHPISTAPCEYLARDLGWFLVFGASTRAFSSWLLFNRITAPAQRAVTEVFRTMCEPAPRFSGKRSQAPCLNCACSVFRLRRWPSFGSDYQQCQWRPLSQLLRSDEPYAHYAG
jgi:hypothetical protein